MSAKRQATSDLNHDNWDREEEPEERGTFRTASVDELKNRVIKKARRKVATASTGNDSTDSSSGTKSVFSGFSGFGKPAAPTTAGSFSFLSKIPAASGSVSSSSSLTTTPSTEKFSFGGASTAASSSNDVAKPSTTLSFGNASSVSKIPAASSISSTSTFSFGSSAVTAIAKEAKVEENKTDSNSKTSNYYAKLKGLNQAVSEWIKTHVDKNPLCILSPIFNDYEKYLKEIESEKPKPESDAKSGSAVEKTIIPSITGSSAVAPIKSDSSLNDAPAKTNGFSFGLKKPEENDLPKPITSTPSTTFSFGIKPATETSLKTSGFSFGKALSSTEDTPAVSKPFSFTPGSTPFSFGNIKPPAAPIAPTSGEGQEDEDEEPPKNEFKQVVEEDAVYSKKCKVFVKKDGNFVDKGVGTVYLKPIEATGKTQLLVRADTNLGNILVNLILSSAIPSQRMGKNNVMMVCLPTPEVEKPTPMLLRVKTGEEADELLENIEKYKK